MLGLQPQCSTPVLPTSLLLLSQGSDSLKGLSLLALSESSSPLYFFFYIFLSVFPSFPALTAFCKALQSVLHWPSNENVSAFLKVEKMFFRSLWLSSSQFVSFTFSNVQPVSTFSQWIAFGLKILSKSCISSQPVFSPSTDMFGFPGVLTTLVPLTYLSPAFCADSCWYTGLQRAEC